MGSRHLPPWFEAPPGGVVFDVYGNPHPRFWTGTPDVQARVTPFDHVYARNGNGTAVKYNPGTPQGNTGFRGHDIGGIAPKWLEDELDSQSNVSGIGDVSESGKTAMTGLFLAGAALLVFLMYKK